MQQTKKDIEKKSKNSFEALGTILIRTIKGSNIFYEELKLVSFQKYWPAVAGELQRYVQVTGFKNKILYLEAASSSWAQQLMYYKQKIIDKYQKYLGQKINDIKISSTGIVRIKERNKRNELTKEALKNFDNFFDEVDDPEIKERLKNILKKAKELELNDQRKHCAVCGLKLDGDKLVCQACKEKKIKVTKAIIKEYLLEAPWSRYTDIIQDLPNIDEKDYHQVKEQLIKSLADQLMQSLYDLKKFGLKQKNDQRIKFLQETALRYTMLRTGLTPGKINDNILKEYTGDKIYRALYSQKK